MKSYHRHLILTGLLSLVLSCSKSEGEAPSNYPEENKGKIYSAVIDTAETKTILEGKSVIWQETDKVALFTSQDKQLYKVKEGCAGTKSTTLVPVNNTIEGNFRSTIAFYPYDSALSCEDYYYDYYDCRISVNMPNVQKYVPHSFGPDIQPMLAYSAESNSSSLSFYNLYGLLKVRLKGQDIIVKKIEISGNENEKIAGLAECYTRKTNSAQCQSEFIFSEESLSSITLDCGDGVALNANTSTDFYIALPPKVFSNGITMRVTTDNDIIEKKSLGKLDIRRSSISQMPDLVLIGNRQKNNQILYSSIYGRPSSISCDAQLISNEYKDGQGILTFDKAVKQVKNTDGGVVSVVLPNRVKSIGEGAFSFCSDLRSIIIPNSVMEINSGAFQFCSDLKSVVLPENITSIEEKAFYYCSSLCSIEIPNSVTRIESSAFGKCSSLSSIKLPNNLTTIGDGAFYNCESLNSIEIPNSVTEIGNRAFSGCENLPSVVIPDGITEIDFKTFEYCYRLSSIILPNSLTKIGERAFSDCHNLSSVVIPNSVTKIGPNAFSYCYDLSSVVIPDGVTEIASGAFEKCIKLSSVIIPNSVTKIGPNAFSYCCDLSSVVIPDGVTEIGTYAFSNCNNLFSVVIPDGVTEIASGAFENCTNLSSIVIPNGVTSIRSAVFEECLNLKSVVLPESITSIKEKAFHMCSSLSSIEIPNSVTSIGSNAFGGGVKVYLRSYSLIA